MSRSTLPDEPMKITVTIELPAPPGNVWDYVRDISSHTEWMRDAATIEITSTRSEGIGTTFTCRTVVGPLRTLDRMEVTRWEPGQLIGVRHEGLVTGEGTFSLSPSGQPLGSETTFQWREELKLPWFLGGRLAEGVARPVLTWVWKRNLQGLRARILERIRATTDTAPTAPGRLIGIGRGSEVRDLGPDQVIRIPAAGHDLDHEATAMQLVRNGGFPAPALIEQRSDGSLVMQRLEGPTMLEDLTARPWRLRRHAVTLARLHRDLGRIHAPNEWTRVSEGTSVVHLDLHPDNVKLTPTGPMVFDWSHAAAGNPGFDAALTYVILRTAEPGAGPVARAVIGAWRRRFALSFAKAFGETELLANLRPAAELRMLDPHLTALERERAFALARGELD